MKKIQRSLEAVIALPRQRQNKLLNLLNFGILTNTFCYLWSDAELLNTRFISYAKQTNRPTCEHIDLLNIVK